MQLTGNASAANVEKGGTFYNTNAKSKLTGTLRNVTGDSTIDHSSNNATTVVLGDAAFISTNSDNVARAQIRFNSTRGVIEPNTLIGIEQSKMATAGGLTAAKLMKNQSAFGIAGTATSDATANAVDILTGKTAYINGSKITGTMATLAGGTYTANNTTQTISCSGKKMTSNIIINPASKIPNFTAENIKKDVTIAGTKGTAPRVQLVNYLAYDGNINYTGYSETASSRTITVGDVYSTWDTIVMQLNAVTDSHGPVCISLSKGKNMRVCIITEKYNNYVYQNVYLSVERTSTGVLKISPFRGNTSGTFRTVIKVFAVYDGIVNNES